MAVHLSYNHASLSYPTAPMSTYPELNLYIDGEWRKCASDLPVLNPATEEEIGRLPRTPASTTSTTRSLPRRKDSTPGARWRPSNAPRC